MSRVNTALENYVRMYCICVKHYRLPVYEHPSTNCPNKSRCGLSKNKPTQRIDNVNIKEERNEIIRQSWPNHTHRHAKHEIATKVEEMSEQESTSRRAQSRAGDLSLQQLPQRGKNHLSQHYGCVKTRKILVQFSHENRYKYEFPCCPFFLRRLRKSRKLSILSVPPLSEYSPRLSSVDVLGVEEDEE